jgi:hypothetical protein
VLCYDLRHSAAQVMAGENIRMEASPAAGVMLGKLPSNQSQGLRIDILCRTRMFEVLRDLAVEMVVAMTRTSRCCLALRP